MSTRDAHDFTAAAVLTAAQLDGLPGGVIGRTRQESDYVAGTATSEVVIPDLQETVDVNASRLIEITVQVHIESDAALDIVYIALRVDGDQVARARHQLILADEPLSIVCVALEPSGGGGTWVVDTVVCRADGSGSLTARGSGINPGRLIIEDAGPSF